MLSRTLSEVGPGVVNTVILTVVAFAIGAIAAVPITVLSRSSFAPLRGIVRAFVQLVRAVPVLLWLFIVFFGLPQYGVRPTPMGAAIVTLGVVSAVYISEIYRGGLAAIDRGQVEASLAVGLGKLDTAFRIIGPQMFRVVLPPVATYMIGLLKDSALASTIGVVEITYRANTLTQVTGKGLSVYFVTGVIYLALSLPLAIVSRRVDSRLRAKLSMA